MGKRRNGRKGKVTYKNRKLAHNHNNGPSLHGRNTAHELTPHNNGPRYTPAANTPSSQRIQSAGVNSEFELLHKSTKAAKACRRRSAAKNRKQLNSLSPISLEGSNPMSKDDIMNTKFSYFSGGVDIPFNEKTEVVYSVEKYLKVIVSPNLSFGLIHKRVDSSSADIILCPRNDIIKCGLNNADLLCTAFDNVIRAAPLTVRGSKSQNVRCDIDTPLRYSCIGTHVNQGGKGGITPFSAALEQIDEQSHKLIMQIVGSVEHLYCKYISHEEISIVTKAIELVNAFTLTMPASKSNPNNPNPKKAQFYGALAVGIDVLLATHTDKDFAYSAVIVLCRSNEHMNDERVLVYFAFPALGIAIPLKLGDVLFFNPNEPHCITSRVNESDHIYCASLYLKSASLGLNNNSIPLTNNQKTVLEYKKGKM